MEVDEDIADHDEDELEEEPSAAATSPVPETEKSGGPAGQQTRHTRS